MEGMIKRKDKEVPCNFLISISSVAELILMAEFFNKFQLMLKLEKKSKKSLTLEESHSHQVSFYDIYLKNLMDKSYMHTE